MSQKNVEFVGNFFETLRQGNEAWDLLPPGFVIDLSRRLVDPVVLRGPDEFRAFYRDLEAAWDGGAAIEVEEVIDVADRVLVLIRYAGRGAASGAEVASSVWNLWAFRDGEPASWTYLGEGRSEALEAAGLSE
jgi:ketosteroid isomerase-like protein